MLPPEMTATTGPSHALGHSARTASAWWIHPAAATAPLGSDTTRTSRARDPTVDRISASVTVTIPSSRSRRCAKVSSDNPVRRPSATVRYRDSVGHDTSRPARRLSAASAASSGSTPMTAACGRSAFTAVATPEASPPPPTGTSTQATDGRSSTISRPTVP
jgi:hypothetical protein